MVYVLGLLVSIIGWYVGRVVSYRIVTGHYHVWSGVAAGFIEGAVRSLPAIAPSLGLFWLMLHSRSSSWIPFAIAIVYPAICGLLSDKNPDKVQIAHTRATIMGNFGPIPYSRKAFDQEIRIVDEHAAWERLYGWGELIGCVTVIGIAAAVWYRLYAFA